MVVAAFLITLGGGALGPGEANAWGAFGHQTICDLAYRNLTTTSKDTLKRIMRVDEGGIQVPGKGRAPDRWYTSFNIGCLEEDKDRGRPADHFINVSRDTREIPEKCPTKTCVLAAIEADKKRLADTSLSDEERVFALFALGHWIGDIHQPLHVSFQDDRGGNSITADLVTGCGASRQRADKLHAVWDNCLLQSALFERVRQSPDFNPDWEPNTLTYRAVDELQKTTTLAKERELVEGAPVQWANESYKITLAPGVGYCIQVGPVCRYSQEVERLKTGGKTREVVIDQTYLNTYGKDAEDQVRAAGFRLAHLINQALDPAYQGPVRNRTQP